MLASRFAPQLIFLAVLVVSRLFFHALGLAPDPAIVVDHWQHIDLRFLAADPIGSLWDLHSQPPLWNAILAGAVALAGPDGDAVTAVMYGFHLILTAAAGLLTIDILRRLGFSKAVATVLATLVMLSPNTLYFETYIFYPHFTFFMVTVLVWLLVQVKRDGALWPVAGALGVLTALSWTWAIFHPAFIALAGAAPRRGGRAAGRSRRPHARSSPLQSSRPASPRCPPSRTPPPTASRPPRHGSA